MITQNIEILILSMQSIMMSGRVIQQMKKHILGRCETVVIFLIPYIHFTKKSSYRISVDDQHLDIKMFS